MATDERDLLVIVYREIAIAALASIAPLGNPHRMTDHFLPRAEEIRQRLEYSVRVTPASDRGNILEIFGDNLPTLVREALDLVGYDEDTIVAILADFS